MKFWTLNLGKFNPLKALEIKGSCRKGAGELWVVFKGRQGCPQFCLRICFAFFAQEEFGIVYTALSIPIVEEYEPQIIAPAEGGG